MNNTELIKNILGNSDGVFQNLSESSIVSPDTLVIGDIHYTGRVRAFFGGTADEWRAYWKTVFSWIRKIALDNSVKNIIFLGDITDDIPSKFSVSWYMYLVSLFSDMAQGFNVTIMSGNHDMNTDNSHEVLDLIQEALPNVKIDGNNIFNYAQGSKYRKNEILPIIDIPIGYGHEIFGWDSGEYFGQKTINIPKIFSGKLFITGHIHTPCYKSDRASQTLINLGSIVPTSIDQLGGERYVMLLNEKSLSYGFIKVPNWESEWNTMSASKTIDGLKHKTEKFEMTKVQDFWGFLKENIDNDTLNYLQSKMKEKE